MNGPIVVDVGNTRIKWGRCEDGHVSEVVALPPDAPAEWQGQVDAWTNALASPWVISGVCPDQRDALVAWLKQRQVTVTVIDSYEQLPLVVSVDEPEKVGIDRLLNAVAANTRRALGGVAFIVDAGSAVTVDVVDMNGAFRGGAIFPGMRLMAKALHEYTALLPLVEVDGPAPPPGTTTADAIRAGIYAAVLGGIHQVISRYWEQYGDYRLSVFFTGGDGQLFSTPQRLGEVWPEMTLEGILHSVATPSANE